MYYPYLRGKQYELLALRELYEKKLIGKHVFPIIEPVRFNSGFVLFLEKTKGFRTYIITNPQVGSFLFDYSNLNDDSLKERLSSSVIGSLVEFGQIIPVSNQQINNVPVWIPAGCSDAAFCFAESELCKDRLETSPDFEAFIVDDSRSLLRLIPENSKKIVFKDCFPKQKKNSLYTNSDDEFFSDEHLFFEKDGFDGFSDASVIGMDYSDSGYAPTAVAIHLVYFSQNMELRVHHFVSEENYERNNIAGMFKSAAEAIPDFVKQNKVRKTSGLTQLLEKIDSGSFPGLGVLKKYSIMHHLELMEAYFAEKQISV